METGKETPSPPSSGFLGAGSVSSSFFGCLGSLLISDFVIGGRVIIWVYLAQIIIKGVIVLRIRQCFALIFIFVCVIELADIFLSAFRRWLIFLIGSQKICIGAAKRLAKFEQFFNCNLAFSLL